MALVSDSQSFMQPHARFRPAAYWFWHSIPSDDEMRSQLFDFREQGFGTILIQCRLAFPRELYLSADFLAAYRRAVEIMASLGLVAGLYDDYNWNSGQAAGRTVEGADHLRECHLFWAATDVAHGSISGIATSFLTSMGKDIAGWIYEGAVPIFGKWQLVSAALIPREGTPESMIDVTDKVVLAPRAGECGFACSMDVLEGFRLMVSVSARCETSRLINYLMPEAGERFVEVGLAPYAAALQGLMPDPLAFLFFDQPAAGFYIWDQMSGNPGNSLLYTPTLKAEVEAEIGKPFGTVMTALVMDIGPETSVLRKAFYRVYTSLLHRGFFEPLKTFCRAHGLRLTGHEILPHVGSWALNGGFTSIDPRVAPAVDFFGMEAFRDENAVDANNFEGQLSPKLGDSVARANGRTRSIVEIYATATRTERRGAGQWELTPAVLRSQSIRLHLLGARQVLMHALYQTDGSGENGDLFVNPRFDFAPGLNFEPWWPHYRAIADETARLSAFLEDLHPETPVALLYPLGTAWAEGPRHAHARDFGLWCETLDSIGCGYMIIDERALETGVIDGDTLKASGLRFSAVALPSVTVISAGAKEKLGSFARAGGRIWASGDLEDVERVAIAGAIHIAAERRAIAMQVGALPAKDPRMVAGDGVRHICGWDDGGCRRIVLFNDSPDAETVEFSGGFAVESWDCRTAAITDQGKASTLRLQLEPGELICLRLRPLPDAHGIIEWPGAVRAPSARQILDSGWSFRTDEDTEPQPIHVDHGWQQQGHPAFSGIGIYACRFDVSTRSDVVLELPDVAVAATAFVDGVRIGACNHAPYRIALGATAPGTHELEVRVANTAANRYYAGTPFAGDIWPDRSGLTQPPILLFFPTDNS